MKKAKISDLTFDDKNFNKHNPYGMGLVEKSLQKFGGARSILIDKNNKIIAGNATIEAAGQIGLEDLEIIESDGTKIIAVKRTDIDLDSPKGRELALADNASAKANIVFDAEVIEAELGEAICEEWGIEKAKDYSAKNQEIDIDSIEDEMIIKLKYTEDEYRAVKEQLSKIAHTPEQAVWKLLGNE